MNAAISWRSQECNTPWIFISSSRHLIFLVHRVANTVVQSIIPQPHGQRGDPLSTLQLNTRWNTGLFWMTEHIDICIWTGHNNSSCEDELPLFAELGSSACQRGAEGTPRAWGNFTCAMGCWGAHWDLQVPDEGSFQVPTLSFPAAQGDIIRLTPSFNFQFAAEKPQNFRAVSSPLCFYSDSFYSLENSRTVCAKQRKTTSSTLQSLKIKCQTGQEKLMW